MYKVLKNSILGLVLAAVSSSVVAEPEAAPATPAPTNDDIAYFLGYQFGTSLVQRGSGNLNPDVIYEALKQSMNGAASTQPDAMQNAVVTELNERLRRQQEQALALLKSNSEAFLADNKNREGIQVTSSGLQYEVIEEGSGASPTAADQVTVHYEGRLITGEVFDSSVQRGQPATFGLGRVIAGWTEGLQLMKVGGHTRFYIPADLAYGQRSTGSIPPNSALIFDVQLIDVVSETPTN